MNISHTQFQQSLKVVAGTTISSAPEVKSEPAPEGIAPASDSVEFSGSSQDNFRSLSPQERSAYAGQLRELHTKGQLWVEKDDQLKRATPMEIRQQLDSGDSRAKLVTLLSRDTESSTESLDSFEAQASNLGLFSQSSGSRKASTESSVSKTVHYVASPIESWIDLDPEFSVPEDKGVTGTQFLPPSGGSVTRSVSWEKDWLHRSMKSSDVLGGWVAATAGATNNSGSSSSSSETVR